MYHSAEVAPGHHSRVLHSRVLHPVQGRGCRPKTTMLPKPMQLQGVVGEAILTAPEKHVRLDRMAR